MKLRILSLEKVIEKFREMVGTYGVKSMIQTMTTKKSSIYIYKIKLELVIKNFENCVR